MSYDDNLQRTSTYVDGSNNGLKTILKEISYFHLLLGFKVMETVGKKVVKLDYAKGFAAQFATAMSVNTGSIFGLPLSTTHCMVGSLLGLILVQKKLQIVKDVYPDEVEEEAKEEVKEQKKDDKDSNEASYNI